MGVKACNLTCGFVTTGLAEFETEVKTEGLLRNATVKFVSIKVACKPAGLAARSIEVGGSIGLPAELRNPTGSRKSK